MFVLEELCKWLELTGFLTMTLSCWSVSNSLKCSIKLYTRRFLLLTFMLICMIIRSCIPRSKTV
ncbi:hypothetical protein Hanom_Chr08g00693861 [Helianthus anomalus]